MRKKQIEIYRLKAKLAHLRQNAEKTFECYQHAADLGSRKAKLMLATMLIRGEGCKQDIHKGLALAKTSAKTDLEHSRIAYSLAKESITRQDIATALRILHRSVIKHQDELAALALAKGYYTGQLSQLYHHARVEKNLDLAIYYQICFQVIQKTPMLLPMQKPSEAVYQANQEVPIYPFFRYYPKRLKHYLLNRLAKKPYIRQIALQALTETYQAAPYTEQIKEQNQVQALTASLEIGLIEDLKKLGVPEAEIRSL